MISIRKATSIDIPQIVVMHMELQLHVEASNPNVWKLTEQGKTRIASLYDGSIIYVAEIQGTITGFISGQIQTREDTTPRTVGFIQTLYVKPEHRRRGTATKLIKTLCSHYTQHNIEEINLRYVNGNKEATQLWTKLGFTPVITTANTPLNKLNQKLHKPHKKPLS